MASQFSYSTYADRFSEMAAIYRFRDQRAPKSITVFTDNPSGNWQMTIEFADGCVRTGEIPFNDSAEMVAMVGRMSKQWFLEHGYRPKYASELHGFNGVQ